ncbi:MAG: hypothetical protein Q4C95_00930 [Planctomycetia bacterium]|nr:hypothetical protein [Planctomycetia bacterium]
MSIFSYLKTLYESSPSCVKDALYLLPFTWMAGREYRNTAKVLKQWDYASKEEIDAYQAAQLTKILTFATDHVPFYRSYKQYVEKYPASEAIKFFPLIMKDVIQNDFSSFVPDCIHSIPHRTSQTGGSTGNQLQFYEDWTTIPKEIASIHYQWKRVGYTPDSRKVTFRGVSFPQSSKDLLEREPCFSRIVPLSVSFKYWQYGNLCKTFSEIFARIRSRLSFCDPLFYRLDYRSRFTKGIVPNQGGVFMFRRMSRGI